MPAFTVHAHADGLHCMQYCLPMQNSTAIKAVLRADIGLCCRAGPGFNNFQGMLSQRVPGVAPLRAWEYTAGESAF